MAKISAAPRTVAQNCFLYGYITSIANSVTDLGDFCHGSNSRDLLGELICIVKHLDRLADQLEKEKRELNQFERRT